MRTFMKGVLRVIFLMLFGFIITTITIYSVRQSHEIPTQQEISALDNVSKSLSLSQKRAVNRSRQSFVQVISISPEVGGISTSSGTYIQFKGKFYILTVAHSLIGDCEGTVFVTEEGVHPCVQMKEINNLIDYSLIEVEEITERQAIQIPAQMPRGEQWQQDFSIMTKTYYTGFPNAMGPFTVDGKVVGYNENDFLYIQSYGWSGCSGAGVFSENGNLIAYIMALTVGHTERGVNVSEDILIAVPLFKVNWLSLTHTNQEKENEKDNEEPSESKLPDSAGSDSGLGHSD